MATAIYEIPDDELATVLAEYLGREGMLPGGYYGIKVQAEAYGERRASRSFSAPHLKSGLHPMIRTRITALNPIASQQ